MRDLFFKTAAALASLFLACQTPSAVVQPRQAASTEEQAKDIERKTVALVSPDCRPFCAGVWVSDTGILTAAHCVEVEARTSGYLYVTRPDMYLEHDLRVRADAVSRLSQLVAVDQEHDLALLRAFHPLPAHPVARVAMDTIAPGSVVSTVGHSYGLWWSYSSGQVAAFRYYEGRLYTQATVPIHRGNSGGGLFDNQNNLVGVVHSCLGSVDAPATCGSLLNLFAHAQYVDAFVRKYAWH